MQAPDNRENRGRNTIKGAELLGLSVPTFATADVKGKACHFCHCFLQRLAKVTLEDDGFRLKARWCLQTA
jgi:hypothetical protein